MTGENPFVRLAPEDNDNFTTELAKFPLSIYSPVLQFLFSWILPFAFTMLLSTLFMESGGPAAG